MTFKQIVALHFHVRDAAVKFAAKAHTMAQIQLELSHRLAFIAFLNCSTPEDDKTDPNGNLHLSPPYTLLDLAHVMEQEKTQCH